MSRNIIDSVIELRKKESLPIGLIISRRQVSYNEGYTTLTTKALSNIISESKTNIILERDHAGPHQLADKDSDWYAFRDDIKYVDIIHIDPFKICNSKKEAIFHTIYLIKYCLLLGFKGKFEVGTEASIFPYTETFLDELLSTLDKEQLLSHIKYVVIQSGQKLVGIQNIGTFDKQQSKKMIQVVKNYSKQTKEHNCDYRPIQHIEQLFQLGLDSINLAPEVGGIETNLVLKSSPQQIGAWYQMCINEGHWKRWFRDMPFSKVDIIRATGHYFFENPIYREIKQESGIEDKEIKSKIKDYIRERVTSVTRKLK